MKQEQNVSRAKKYAWAKGFIGFIGCLGFLYFKEHDPHYLMYFGFFSFFVYFITGKLAQEMPDERWIENHKKALLQALKVSLFALVIVGFYPSFGTLTETITIMICMIGFVLTLLTYGIAFYYYDKH